MPLSRPERELARDLLEWFVLRARKVMAHQLVRDHMDLLQKVADGTFKVKVIKNPETGDREQRFLLELPPEEALESFAARLRPFAMKDERVYWELVLDAIADLSPQELLDEVIDIDGLRAVFADHPGKEDGPGVFRHDRERSTDRFGTCGLLAEFGRTTRPGNQVGGWQRSRGLDERYRAAAGAYARLGAAVSAALNVIAHLVREGVLIWIGRCSPTECPLRRALTNRWRAAVAHQRVQPQCRLTYRSCRVWIPLGGRSGKSLRKSSRPGGMTRTAGSPAAVVTGS